jgi:hypothetical protein
MKIIFRFPTKNFPASPAQTLAPSDIGGIKVFLFAPPHNFLSALHFLFFVRNTNKNALDQSAKTQ